MVRTDPGTLRDTTVAWIDRRGNPPSGSLAMASVGRMAAEDLGCRGNAAGVYQAQAAEYQHNGGGDEGGDRGDAGDHAHGPEGVGVEQQTAQGLTLEQLAARAPVKQVKQMKISAHDLYRGAAYWRASPRPYRERSMR